MLSVKARQVNLIKDIVIRVLGKDAQFYFMSLPTAHNFIQRAFFERSVLFSTVLSMSVAILYCSLGDRSDLHRDIMQKKLV